jgi:hypothetical protein
MSPTKPGTVERRIEDRENVEETAWDFPGWREEVASGRLVFSSPWVPRLLAELDQYDRDLSKRAPELARDLSKRALEFDQLLQRAEYLPSVEGISPGDPEFPAAFRRSARVGLDLIRPVPAPPVPTGVVVP